MMVLTWSILLLIAVTVLLLFTPFVLRIDTTCDRYQLRWGWVCLQLVIGREGPGYRFTAPFAGKERKLFPDGTHTMPGSPGGTKRERGVFKGRMRFERIIPGVLGSFHVRRLHWSLDTGDPLWNAWLFPVFHLLRARGHDVRISFTGRNGLLLVLDNNLYRLLKVVLFSSINQPTHKSHEQGHE